MKNDSLPGLLLGVLALSALASVILLLALYVPADRELRSLQGQAFGINNRRMAITSLINEAMEYSKKNPAIDPILETVGAKPSKTAPATTSNKPAAK